MLEAPETRGGREDKEKERTVTLENAIKNASGTQRKFTREHLRRKRGRVRNCTRTKNLSTCYAEWFCRGTEEGPHKNNSNAFSKFYYIIYRTLFVFVESIGYLDLSEHVP